MHVKDFTARVKAAGSADGLQEGQFTALVSVFGNEDSVGDVVMPGAFTDTLAEWKAKGDPLPVIWSHDWGDPFSHIGFVTDAKETAQGLEVTGQIEDLAENEKAAQVYRLLKGRRVRQFSFAYDVLDGGWGERDGQDVFELRKLAVHEVGPTLLGANQETELLAVKAARLAANAKEGRVLAARHLDRLKDAHTALGDVIAAAETSDPKRSDAPTGAPADTNAGQPAAATNDDQARAPKSTSAESPRHRSAQAAARLHLLTLTNGDQS